MTPFLMSNFLFLKTRLLNNIDEKGEYIIEIQLEEWTCKISVIKVTWCNTGLVLLLRA